MSATAGRFLRDPRDVIVALRLLVLTGLSMLGLGQPPSEPAGFWITTIVYGLTNLGYMASGAHRFLSPRVQRAVFLFDVLVVSALIVMRGQQVSEFIVAYFTLVLMAAVVQGIGNAALNALVVCAVYGSVSLWGRDPSTLLTFPILAQFAFFLVVSIFMSHLAEGVRQRVREREREEAVRRELEAAVAARTRDLSRSLEELEAARDRLAASDRLAAIGLVSAGVAHDIRNPVAAVKAALDEAPELVNEIASGQSCGSRPPAEVLIEAIRDARAACDQLQRLASDLTSAARVTPAEPVPVGCREALESAARLLRHRVRPPLSIAVRCTTAASMRADPGRLQQLLLNLGGNGLDAMEGRPGVLTLSAEDASAGRVRLCVSDTGVGMTPAVAEKAFKAFFTTKPAGKGTGLGLHLVHEIANAHGASIDVESKPGEGTRIRVEWPTAEPTADQGGNDDVRGKENRGADRGRRGEHPSCARAGATA